MNLPKTYQTARPSTTATSLPILDRVLGEQAANWSDQDAASIMNLYLSDQLDSTTSEETKRELLERFGVYLELVKCQARIRLRSLKEN